MDDETGWDQILVESWGPLVLGAVVGRVQEAFATRLGILVATATDPDDAPADWVEDVHGAIVAGIRTETGADIEDLGSQTAWATYDDVWAALGRQAGRVQALVAVPEHRVGQVWALLAELPPDAVRHAGAVPQESGQPAPLVVDGRTRVHIDGVFRWLATDDTAPSHHRALARALIAVVRDDPLTG